MMMHLLIFTQIIFFLHIALRCIELCFWQFFKLFWLLLLIFYHIEIAADLAHKLIIIRTLLDMYWA